MLQRVNNELLLGELLQGACMDKPRERLRVILFIRDALPSSDIDERNKQWRMLEFQLYLGFSDK